MSFASPGAAVLAAIGLLIIGQYLLKVRRPPLTVPSTFLWRRVLADTRASSPWQRLRAEPLLLLQLAAVALLIAALMRPFVLRAGAPDTDLVLIVDSSINSRLQDQGHMVFDAELGRAIATVADLPPGRAVSIIGLDGHPRVLLAGSTDRAAVSALLSGMRPSFESPAVSAAIELAHSVAQGTAGAAPRVVLLRSALTARPSAAGDAGLLDVPFGHADSANLGVAALAAAPQPDGTISALMRVANSGRSVQTSDIDILADGKLRTVLRVTVPAGSSVLQTATFLGPAAIVEARIANADAMSADNDAWTAVATSATRRVLLVTPGNVFLATALRLTAGTSVVTSTVRALGDAAPTADVAIFDGTLPATLPDTNLLLIDPPRSEIGIQVGPARAAGPPLLADDPAGILRYVTAGEIHVKTARRLSVPDWAHVALRDTKGPLILEGERPGSGISTHRIVVLAFSLSDSDLPLGLNFPILIDNALNWLAPASSVDRSELRPGEFVRVTIPNGSTSATVATPDGRTVALFGSGGEQFGQVLFTDTATPGAYTVSVSVAGHRQLSYFTVNPGVPSSQPATSAPSTPTIFPRPPARQGQVPLDLTAGVALAVLAMLAFEWYVSMRAR